MKTWQKIIVTVTLAGIAAYFMGCGAPSVVSSAADAADLKPTVGKLSDANRTFNDAFFYGGLPTYLTRIELADLSKDQDSAFIHHDSDGLWHIQIDPHYNTTEEQAEMSLIHEDCHQYDSINGIDEGEDKHGQKFQDCMIRIADKGGFKGLW
jgi:hypothetical protein